MKGPATRKIFTIILVLEWALFESQVEAFTIQRPTELTNSDLSLAESTHRLEVRNDLKSDVRPKEVKDESPPLQVPIKTTAKTEDIQKNVTAQTETTNVISSSETTTAQLSASPKPTTPTLEIIESNLSVTTVPSILDSINITSNVTQETADITTTPKVENTSTARAEKNNENLKKSVDNGNFSSTTQITQKDLRKNKTDNITTINQNKGLVNITNIVNSTHRVNATSKVNSTTIMKPISLLNVTKLVNITNQAKAASQTSLLNSSIPNINMTMENKTTWNNHTEKNRVELKIEESNLTSYSTETVFKSTDESINYDSQMINTTNESSTIKLSSDNKNNDLEVKSSTESRSTTEPDKSDEELISEYSGITVKPYWKQYTTIDRMKKRLNSTKDSVIGTDFAPSNETGSRNETESRNETLYDTEIASSTEKDLLQLGTAQTQTNVILETLNTDSEIPSLEQLKNDLLAINKISSTTDYSTESTKSTNFAETQENNTTQPKEKLSEFVNATTNTLEVTTQAYNIVSSKRAGFLDFSTRPLIRAETSTKQENVTSTEVSWNYSDVLTPKTTPRNPTSKTSQSQLVEDALKEELMKEEFLMDSVENAERQQEDRFVSETTPTEKTQLTPVTSIALDTSSEDKLRVKPISTEKPKNGSLYVVSPNYKPLKKIEVQPPKPFVRNPDDNSWRNESLSSLGIVFKANNSSKPLTQVLKNKTETEWNTLLDRYDKGEEPELRARLEKIAEIRKSKKKKINSLGETVYSDYEEAVSGENSNSTIVKSFPYLSNVGNNSSFLDEVEMGKFKTIAAEMFDDVKTTTSKTKKFLDEYEEDDESEYTLPNIDLKKFITSTPTTVGTASVLPIKKQLTPPVFSNTIHINPSDRQPTVQYFPPIEKQQKVVINDYDTVFQKKINVYTSDSPTTFTTAVTEGPSTLITFDFQKNKFELQSRPKLNEIPRRPDQMDKNLYLTHPPQDQKPTNDFVSQHRDAAGYNQASYVIKHLRDFIDEVVKADESSATDEPLQGVTVNSGVHETKPQLPNDYYDYEAQFRKDVINRFAENFNQNSERFKADFPVLYNTSVIHSLPGLRGGGGAESTAFMKRLYEDIRAFQHPKGAPKRYDPNCDRTVELSPAYELHYYVPEEEEKEEVELKTLTRPPNNRLQL